VKIAIGCGVAILIGMLVLGGLVAGGAWWAKGKVEEIAGDQTRITELEEQANKNPFDQPSDGVIREDRFVKFLDARKRIFGVYEKHQADLEARGKKEQADFSDVTKAFAVINEIRLAQAQALVDVGMSHDEYRWLVEQVYKNAWAAEVAKSTGGKSVSEAASEMYDKAADEMEKSRQQAEGAQRAADAQDAEATEKAAEEQKEQLDRSIREMREQAGRMRESAKDMDVPPANIALFRKYEADIKKYAMSGLELIGL
jgi:hypothetical protein